MIEPYYATDTIRLYVGDCREVLAELADVYDAAIVDPPYECTSMGWDHWPDGWLDAVAAVTSSMWCFGSLRMFGTRWAEFTGAGWKFSHDTVWDKDLGTSAVSDRFNPSHELVAHWYQGRWSDAYHEVPTELWNGARVTATSNPQPARVQGDRGAKRYMDRGVRYMRSVIRCRPARRGCKGTPSGHPNEKPVAALTPRLRYAVPAGGVVLDPMAGSGSTGVAAQILGIRAVLVEAQEPYAADAARRLDQGVLSEDAS